MDQRVNKQPYYHTVGLLFTATEEYTALQVKAAIHEAIEKSLTSIVKGTFDVEFVEAEAGNPSDLC